MFCYNSKIICFHAEPYNKTLFCFAFIILFIDLYILCVKVHVLSHSPTESKQRPTVTVCLVEHTPQTFDAFNVYC